MDETLLQYMKQTIRQSLYASEPVIERLLHQPEVQSAMTSPDTCGMVVMLSAGGTLLWEPWLNASKIRTEMSIVAKGVYFYKDRGHGVVSGDLVPAHMIQSISALAAVECAKNTTMRDEAYTSNLRDRCAKICSELELSTGYTQLPHIPACYASTVFERDKMVHVYMERVERAVHADPFNSYELSHQSSKIESIAEYTEIWTRRMIDLKQLLTTCCQNVTLRKCLAAQRRSKSRIPARFYELLREVEQGAETAMNIVRWLKPLEDRVPRISEPFSPLAVQQVFALLSVVVSRCPVFEDCPSAVRHLFQAVIGNLSVHVESILRRGAARTLPDPTPLWHLAPPTLRDRIMTCNDIVKHAKHQYILCKSKALHGSDDSRWNSPASALFARLDALMTRVSDVLKLVEAERTCEVVTQLLVKNSNKHVDDIYRLAMDFREQYRKTAQALAEPLLPVCEPEISVMLQTVVSLTKNIAQSYQAAILEAVSTNYVTAIRCLSTLDELCDLYPSVKEKFISIQPRFLRLCYKELINVQCELRKKECPEIFDRYTPLIGNMIWKQSYLSRVQELHNHLQALDPIVLSSTESELCMKLCTNMLDYLQKEVSDVFQAWSRGESTSELGLGIFAFGEDGKVTVNLAPSLALSRKNCAFFSSRMSEAEQELVMERNRTIHACAAMLLELTQLFNSVIDTMLEEERQLFHAELEILRTQLLTGASSVSWDSCNVDSYVKEVHTYVEALNGGINGLQVLRRRVIDSLDWADAEQCTMFPEVGKCSSAKSYVSFMSLRLEPRAAQLQYCSDDLTHSIKESERVVWEVRKLFRTEGREDASCTWLAYVAFLSKSFGAAVAKSVVTSLQSLHERMRCTATDFQRVSPEPPSSRLPRRVAQSHHGSTCPHYHVYPLTVHYELEELHFDETLVPFQDLSKLLQVSMESVIDSIVSTSKYLRKPTFGGEGPNNNYYVETSSHPKVSEIRAKIMNRVNDVIELALKDIQNAVGSLGTRPMTIRSSTYDLMSSHGLNYVDSELRKFDLDNAHLTKFQTLQKCQWLGINYQPLLTTIIARGTHAKQRALHQLQTHVTEGIPHIAKEIETFNEGLRRASQDDEQSVRRALEIAYILTTERVQRLAHVDAIRQGIDIMQHHVSDPLSLTPLRVATSDLLEKYMELFKYAKQINDQFVQHRDQEAFATKEKLKVFLAGLSEKTSKMKGYELFDLKAKRCLEVDVYTKLEEWLMEVKQCINDTDGVVQLLRRSDLPICDFPDIVWMKDTLLHHKTYWDIVHWYYMEMLDWVQHSFLRMSLSGFGQFIKMVLRALQECAPCVTYWATFRGFREEVTHVKDVILPLLSTLVTSNLKERHWKQIFSTYAAMQQRSSTGDVTPLFDKSFTLERLLQIFAMPGMIPFCQSTTVRALNEHDVEGKIGALEERFSGLRFSFGVWERFSVEIVVGTVQIPDIIDSGKVALMTLQANQYAEIFLERISLWQRNLEAVQDGMKTWIEIHRQWCVLLPIFMEGSIIGAVLDEAEHFKEADLEYMSLTKFVKEKQFVVLTCVDAEFIDRLNALACKICLCEKALLRFLYAKRVQFQRFFLVSDADLLDIESCLDDIASALRHISKIIDSVESVEFAPGSTDIIIALYSFQGERLELHAPCHLDNPEHMFAKIIESMRHTIHCNIHKAVVALGKEGVYPVGTQAGTLPTQAIVMGQFITFTSECESTLRKPGGVEYRNLIESIQADVQNFVEQGILNVSLSQYQVQRTTWIITALLRSRDIVLRLSEGNIESEDSFQWQSQLRYYTGTEIRPTQIRVCDVDLSHQSEYIGLCGSLVMTPLTTRCIITMTQALKLFKGGGPCGPAGTGKTETIKDLARNLGTVCYVFNCSNEMNLYTLGNIVEGLATCGAWGCFDEFNRISVEVLSVFATQVRLLMNALRGGKKLFVCNENSEVQLLSNVGVFITMNPGYLGRIELPDNLKALFRPCPMVVCDSCNICEVLLVAQGFLSAASLAQKLVALFQQCNKVLMPLDHYDWGMRAMKSVIRVAGEFRRSTDVSSDESSSETTLLLRALHYTIFSRLSHCDIASFEMILSGMFSSEAESALRLPQSDDSRAATAAAERLGLMLTESGLMLIHRAVQLIQLMKVTHSLIIFGPAACGKTTVWRISQNITTTPAQVGIVTPCTLSNQELFGFVHETTHEWRDGALSRVFRNFAMESKNTPHAPKWIVLDGPIDPDWVESLNSVMDDNRQLILLSNERIGLHSSMRIILECTGLENASPATVSRCSILFVNANDVGYLGEQTKWLRSMSEHSELCHAFSILCETRLGYVFDFLSKEVKFYMPSTQVSIARTFFSALTAMIGPHLGSGRLLTADCHIFFMMALHFTVSNLLGRAHREIWTPFLAGLMGLSSETITDTYYDARDLVFRRLGEWYPSSDGMQSHDPLNLFIPCRETVIVSNFLTLLVRAGTNVQICGPSGAGKSALALHFLKDFTQHYPDTNAKALRLTSTSTDADLVTVLESLMDHRGLKWTPQAPLILFIDDVNLPVSDKSGTQSTCEFIRVHLDHGFYFEHHHQAKKPVEGIQYLTAINPSIGNKEMNARMLWHFATVSLHTTYERASLEHILDSFVNGWCNLHKLHLAVEKCLRMCVEAVCSSFTQMTGLFARTETNFTFSWTLRDLKVCLYRATLFCKLNQHDFTRCHFVHCVEGEIRRMFRDRLCEAEDVNRFDSALSEFKRKFSEEMAVDPEPLLDPCILLLTGSVSFCGYDPCTWENVMAQFAQLADTYNATNTGQTVVLYPQAVEHITHICNTLSLDGNHICLVGPAATGKKTLTKFACGILGYQYMELDSHSNYTATMLVSDLFRFYSTALKSRKPIVLIVSERDFLQDVHMLVYLQQVMQNGAYHSTLFDTQLNDSLLAHIATVDPMVVAEAQTTSVWRVIQNRVSPLLHIVFCISSPTTFQRWYNAFPTMFSQLYIDIFSPWDEAALRAIALHGLGDIQQTIGLEQRQILSQVFAGVHRSARNKSSRYATSRSYLDFMTQFDRLLQNLSVDKLKERMQHGLQTIYDAEKRVVSLHLQLQKDLCEAANAKERCEELLQVVDCERQGLLEQQENAKLEELRRRKHVDTVNMHRAECEVDLAAMRPILSAGAQALERLDKLCLVELRSMPHPPEEVNRVTSAVLVLTSPSTKIPPPQNRDWAAARAMMGSDVVKWLKSLIEFDRDNIPEECAKALGEYVNSPGFTPESICAASVAAAGLCEWVVNMYRYHQIRLLVKPKENLLKQAEEELTVSQKELEKAEKRVQLLTARFNEAMQRYEDMQNQYHHATLKVQQTSSRNEAATSLLRSLEEEKARWKIGVATLQAKSLVVAGDAMLGAAFSSYMGTHEKSARIGMYKIWLAELERRGLGYTPDLDAVNSVLTTEVERLQWVELGLARDAVSTENAAVLKHSLRVPLLYDPEHQALTFLRGKYKGHVKTMRATDSRKMTETIVQCAELGDACVVTHVAPHLSSGVTTVLTSQRFQRDSMEFIKVGELEAMCRPGFSIYLHTTVPYSQFPRMMDTLCSVIDFAISEPALQEQLLGITLATERADLQAQREEILRYVTEQKMDLQHCENHLLEILSSVSGDVLENEELVQNLAGIKAKSSEIVRAIEVANRQAESLVESCKPYAKFAERCATLYFWMQQMHKVDNMYRYGLETFLNSFEKGMMMALPATDTEERANNLLTYVPKYILHYVTLGMVPRHRLLMLCLLSFSVLLRRGDVHQVSLDFLFHTTEKRAQRPASVLQWCGETSWNQLCALCETSSACSSHQAFSTLVRDVPEGTKWKQWADSEQPEKMPFPFEYRVNHTFNQLAMLSTFCKMLIVRCLRPDRVMGMLEQIVSETLGADVLVGQALNLQTLASDVHSSVPLLFLLSRGAYPQQVVEDTAATLGFTEENHLFRCISMGQGQETSATQLMKTMSSSTGGWCLLSNIHLVPEWLTALEIMVSGFADQTLVPSFRLLLTSEPCSYMPVALLQVSFKISTEPPRGVKQNILLAAERVPNELYETFSQVPELNCAVSCMTLLHAVLIERVKFGLSGWNQSLAFTFDDVHAVADILARTAAHSKPTKDGLQYFISEVVYGGHITDEWDRRLCRTYVEKYFSGSVRKGSELCTGISAYAPHTMAEFVGYIEASNIVDNPALFGLHSSAALDNNARMAESLINSAREMFSAQAQDTFVMTSSDALLHHIETEVTHVFPSALLELTGSERKHDTFYVALAHEVECFRNLQKKVQEQLKDLVSTLHGETTMDAHSLDLKEALLVNRVPRDWATLTPVFSHKPLSQWLVTTQRQYQQLFLWMRDGKLPEVTNFALLFNPLVFLMCMRRNSASKNQIDLNETFVDVLPPSKSSAEADVYYCSGFVLVGARLDEVTWSMEEPTTRAATVQMPPLPLYAGKYDRSAKVDKRDTYECPVYASVKRGRCLFELEMLSMAHAPSKWILGGVAMYLDS